MVESYEGSLSRNVRDLRRPSIHRESPKDEGKSARLAHGPRGGDRVGSVAGQTGGFRPLSPVSRRYLQVDTIHSSVNRNIRLRRERQALLLTPGTDTITKHAVF